MYSNDITKGIFSRPSLNDNQIEFCIVSDVHIANDATDKKKARNDYVFDSHGNPLSGEAYTLKRFCDKITISGENRQLYDDRHVLVLLGDIINGEECEYFECYNSYAYKLLHKTIEPYLSYGNVIYIAGNHDKNAKFYNTVAKFPRKSVIETIDSSSRKEYIFKKCGIIFEHGHKFDCLCTGKNFLGLMGDFASDVVVNLCSPNLEDLLRCRSYYTDHSTENSLRTIPKDTRIKSMNSECRRVANGALKLLSKHDNDCHTIICGHTHQSPVTAVVYDNGHKLTYINTGKFSRDGYLNVVAEQSEDGKWHLIE